MFERRISEMATRGVHDDHKTDRHSPEYIEGKESLFGNSHLDLFRMGQPSSETKSIGQPTDSDFFLKIPQFTELALMARKIVYLINPISGTARKDRLREMIIRKTKATGIDFDILPTRADGDYSRILEISKGGAITDVVICGGDGTVNAVVKSLQGTDIRIGIIPMGSGNGLAFAAKIPKQPDEALDLIFKGWTSPTDAFYVNDQFSCMLSGIGFDAEVAHEFSKQKVRGLQTYLRISTVQLIKSKPYPFNITLNGRSFSTESYFISIANSNQFGNNFTIAPRALLSDGLLDVVIVNKMNKITLPFAILMQLAGNNPPKKIPEFPGKGNILYFQTDHIQIGNPGNAPLHIDGEPVDGALQIDVRVVPHCFHLIQPES